MKEAKASAEIRQEDEIHALMVYRGCHAPSWKLTAWKLAAQLREAKEREERLNHAMALEPDVLRGWDKTLEERDALRAELGETKEALARRYDNGCTYCGADLVHHGDGSGRTSQGEADQAYCPQCKEIKQLRAELGETKEALGKAEVGLSTSRRDLDDMTRALERTKELVGACEIRMTALRADNEEMKARLLRYESTAAAQVPPGFLARLDGREGGKAHE